MKVRVVSTLSDLAKPLAAHLEAEGHTVEVSLQTSTVNELRYQEGLNLDDVTSLVDAIKPMLPTVTTSEEVTDCDAELWLGDNQELSGFDLKIHADSEALSQRLREKLLPLGYSDDGKEIQTTDSNRLLYGGATPFARQVVRWFLAQEGIRVAEKKEWGDSDNDIWVYASDPAFQGSNIKECFPVEVTGDDYATMLALKERLGALGFTDVRTRLLDTDQEIKFMVRPGPFTRDPAALDEIRETTEALLGEHDVDSERFPVETDEDHESVGAEVMLPLGAHSRDELRPYAGAWPDRWDILIRTDDADEVEDLRELLAENGYTHTRVEPLPTRSAGFRISWGAVRHLPDVGDFLRGVVEEKMQQLGAMDGFSLAVTDNLEESSTIQIDLSTQGIEDGSLMRKIMSGCGEWELTIKSPRPAEYAALRDELRAMNFKDFDTESVSDVGEAVIKYGGAPPILIEQIAEIVHRHVGVKPFGKKEWGDDDDDVWVFIPADAHPQEEEIPGLDLDQWFAEDTGLSSLRPLLELEAETLRVGHITLPRNTTGEYRSLVPKPEQFSHYCIDQRTAETLMHVCESVRLREPCLLEGETSVSKTSIIQYLGMLVNQPVVRINLNGQTDTGELVGRFVPASEASLPIEPKEMRAAAHLLEDESRSILEQAEAEERKLTAFEVQQVMANERMHHHPWRWQDGLIISAMKKGWWVILDELNLAEPQILERLNSVLEREPTIVLTEFDNSVIGSGGHRVHPNFLIFATMNPAEYAGRSALSPAYRDRWRGMRYVPPPAEVEYHAMLHFLVHGTEPDVAVLGRRYLGAQKSAPLSALAELEDIDPFLRALARFHSALEGAVGRAGGRTVRIGARRRERYVFTRRGLLSIMDYLALTAADDNATTVRSMRTAIYRYYLGRIASVQDQGVVVRLLDAAGIGPSTWNLDE